MRRSPDDLICTLPFRAIAAYPVIVLVAGPLSYPGASLETRYYNWRRKDLVDAIERLANHVRLSAKIYQSIHALDEYDGNRLELIQTSNHRRVSDIIRLPQLILFRA
jgi:hypothetical protein